METIKLDLIPGKKMPSLHASQYDDGRDYHIDLTENRVPYVLDGTETISLTVRKCDNTLVTMDVANVFGGKSYIEFRTTEQMNACAGFNYGEITIEKNGTQISSLNFYLQVEGAPDEGGITSQSEINNLARQVHDAVVEELEDNGAEETGYDNTESGLEATNVQDAIDEVNTKIENIPSVDAYTKEQADEKFATKNEVPTKTSQLQNDSSFVTSSEMSTALATKANNTTVVALQTEVTRDGNRIKALDGIGYPLFPVQGGYNITFQGEVSHRDTSYQITNNIGYSVKKGGYITLDSFEVFNLIVYFWDGASWTVNAETYAERFDFSTDGTLYVCIKKANGTRITPEDFNALCILSTYNGEIGDIERNVEDLQITAEEFNKFVDQNSRNKFDYSKITGGMNITYTEEDNGVLLIENGVEVMTANYRHGITLAGSELTLKAGTYTISATATKAKASGNKEAIIGIVYKGTNTKLASTITLANYETPERIHHTFTLTTEKDIVVTVQCRGDADDKVDTKMQFADIMLESGTDYQDYVDYGYAQYNKDVNVLIAERFNIPRYWDSEVADTISKVRNNRLTIGHRIAEFIFITDTHWIDNQKHSPALVEYLSETLEIPLIVFGGDCVTSHHDTKQGCLDELAAFFGAFTYKKDYHLLSTEGNHDNNSNNNSVGLLTADEMYTFFKQRVEEFGSTSPDMDVEGRIAYVDNESQKVRYISFKKATNAASSLLDKVESLITALDSSWTVILFAHNYWWDLDENNVPRTTENSDTVATRLETIKANANCTLAYWQVGHMHTDYSVTTTGDLLIVATTCDTSAPGEMNALSPTMVVGANTEQAFDVVQIDLANKNIYMTRCGAGNDRTFNYT